MLSSQTGETRSKQNPLAFFVFDYDGTLTLENGTFPEPTQNALAETCRMKNTILGIVSGRDISFLKRINNEVGGLFSFLVAENGAVTYFFDEDQQTIIGREWSQKARLIFSNADFHIQFFEIIGTTQRKNTEKIASLLRESKLEAKLIPNKDSMMVCPPNVDKGIGVASAVAHYGPTSELSLTCFGDGDNDVALFGPADVSVAVANAVPQLKTIADVVTQNQGGLGVEEYLTKNILSKSRRDVSMKE